MISRTRIELPLSAPVKRLLLTILAAGEIHKNAGLWGSNADRKIQLKIITAAYERALIKIVVESRHRRRHIAKLTEIGMRTARDLQREEIEKDLSDGTAAPIREQAHRLIAEILE